MRALVTCEDLVIGYRGRGLVPAMNFAICSGRILLVVGRNGAGKSTWIKTLLGLIPPVSGRVVRDSSGPPIKLSYVPQHTGLDELLPVRADTVLGWGRLRGWSFLRPWRRADDRAAERAAAAQVRAAEFATRPFGDLSGGQRQRILFGRLLAGESDLAVLDEPTASMDMSSEKHAYERLATIASERATAIVVVTHTIGVAAEYADEVLFVDRGGGGETEVAAGEFSAGVAVHGDPRTVFAHPLFRHHFGDMERAHAD